MVEKVVIVLGQAEIQRVLQAALDEDGAAALAFVKEVLKPVVDGELGKGRCKPIFEWGGNVPDVVKPPPLAKRR